MADSGSGTPMAWHPKKALLRRSVTDSQQAAKRSQQSTPVVAPKPPLKRASSAPTSPPPRSQPRLQRSRTDALRRRPGSGPDAEPPSASLIPDPNEFLLKHQNRTLAVQLNRECRKSKRLRRRLKRCRQRANTSVQAAAVLNRAWIQLESILDASFHDVAPHGQAVDDMEAAVRETAPPATPSMSRLFAILMAGHQQLLVPLPDVDVDADGVAADTNKGGGGDDEGEGKGEDGDGDVDMGDGEKKAAVQLHQALDEQVLRRVEWARKMSARIAAIARSCAPHEPDNARIMAQLDAVTAKYREAQAALTSAKQRSAALEARCSVLASQALNARQAATIAERTLARLQVDLPDLDLLEHGAVIHPDKKKKKKKKDRKKAGAAATAADTRGVKRRRVEGADAGSDAAQPSTGDSGPSGASKQEIAKLKADLADAQKLAEDRLTELNAIQASKASFFEQLRADVQRQVDGAVGSVVPRGTASPEASQLQQQLALAQAELEGMKSENQGLRTRLQDATKSFHTNVVAAASASAPCSNCETTSQKVARLEAQLASAKADADRCLSLQQLCDKQSVALKQLQERAAKHTPDASSSKKLSERVVVCVKPLEEKIAKLASFLSEKDRIIEVLKEKERLGVRNELNRMAQEAGAKDGVQAPDLEKRISQLTQEAAALERHLAETRQLYLNTRADFERGRAEAKGLRAQLAAAKLENDDLVQEVEALSGEFDNTGARETELLDKLKAKEQQLSALATDGVRQSQLLSRVKDRADAAQALVQAKGAKLAAMQQVVDAQSAQLAALRDKFEDASAIVSRAQYREAAATQQLANASARVKEAQSAMSDALKRAGTAVTESVTHREAKEAAEQEARRLREELEQCNRRLSKALIAAEEAEGRGDGSRRKARGSSDSKMLRMQVKEMRTLLTCTVCQDRLKDCVITKCFHTFCKVCIDERIRTRQRKCPGCAEKFGADDVRTIYLT